MKTPKKNKENRKQATLIVCALLITLLGISLMINQAKDSEKVEQTSFYPF